MSTPQSLTQQRAELLRHQQSQYRAAASLLSQVMNAPAHLRASEYKRVLRALASYRLIETWRLPPDYDPQAVERLAALLSALRMYGLDKETADAE